MTDERPLGDVLRERADNARAVAHESTNPTDRARYDGMADGLALAADLLSAIVERSDYSRFHYGDTFGETKRGTAKPRKT
jgi:hypothetical protein